MLIRLVVSALTAFALFLPAAERIPLTGNITDPSGAPLEGATVMVWKAGVRQGYSTFCPSCYVDCGKRAVTDRAGAYSFQGLDSDLIFELLVIRDGYSPAFIERVDPLKGSAKTKPLSMRPPVDDPEREVRGRVVDAQGTPMAGAVVQPEGVETLDGMSRYGEIKGLEPVAVTNASGDFNLAFAQKATGMVLLVEARAMAPKIVTATTGEQRQTIAVSDGSVIRGRLLNNGKPVANAQLGLSPVQRGGWGGHLKIVGCPYTEIRIGTQPDGSFAITNVPTGVQWALYGRMDSIHALGATPPVEFTTSRDLEEVNAGDIEIRHGDRIRGTVTLSDGLSIPAGMRITMGPKIGQDARSVVIGSDGAFEFDGLPAGDYNIFASVRGYQQKTEQVIKVKGDIANLPIVMEPRAQR